MAVDLCCFWPPCSIKGYPSSSPSQQFRLKPPCPLIPPFPTDLIPAATLLPPGTTLLCGQHPFPRQGPLHLTQQGLRSNCGEPVRGDFYLKTQSLSWIQRGLWTKALCVKASAQSLVTFGLDWLLFLMISMVVWWGSAAQYRISYPL